MIFSSEAKVGIFTLAGLALLVGGVVVLGDFQFQKTYPLHIYFENAGGLPDKGPVKVAGVEVGKVSEIKLEDQRAKVTIQLEKDVKVYSNARAHVSATGLIGSKYLELTLGSPPAELLQPGDSIQGDPSFSFDDVMTKLGELFKEDPETGGMADNLRVTVANLRNVTDALNGSIGRQEKDIKQIVRNIRVITTDLREVTTARKEDMKIALAKIRSVSERLDDILIKVQEGKGIMGKLVGDEKMGKDLKETMTSVREAAKDAQSVMGRIAKIEVYWDYRQRFDFEDDQSRADVGIWIVPRDGKFYLIRGHNLGAREDRTVLGNDIERKNTITAVMGRDFGPLTVFGGAIRSSGGGGIKFRPLFKSEKWNRRLELEAEAYNFSRDEVIQGIEMKGPVYNAGARVSLKHPWLWAGAQVEDINERKNVNAHVNITFKDEDIAYLLGLIGLAR